MTYPNDNIPRKVSDPNRVNSPTVWAVGATFLLALLLALFFYDGRDGAPQSGANPPNVVSNSTSSTR